MIRVGFFAGLAFGFVLAAARLSDYDVIHKMLLLQEFDVFLLMGSAIAVAAPILAYLERRRWQTLFGGPLALPKTPVTRDHVLGSIVFGAGWAVAGTCPGPALVMVAGGNLLGLPVMAGIVTGVLIHDAVRANRQTAGDCGTAPVGAVQASRNARNSSAVLARDSGVA